MNLLSFTVLSPFLGSIVLGILYLKFQNRLSEKIYSFIGVGTVLISTILSFIIGFQFLEDSSISHISYIAFQWLEIDNFQISVGFFADRLSVVMISFITSVALLIHIYATGYMRGDEGFGKFFAYFNFFMGSMLLLVLGDNPIMLFIGWEGVGLASYLLISFYYKNRENVTAGNKAFILNRVGDFGFLMGIILLFLYAGSSDFTYLSLAGSVENIDSEILNWIAILLFVGAMGKSAQIPLYVWLPDAMAGPTPVSALIHAATMVTAGVYMVARFSFLYELTPEVGLFIAYIGVFSALFSAVIATKQRDIKKILAYSTMSQLGYMFVAVGLGFYSGAIFHVFTHAFFKALLFMGAGAVIIAMHHQQDIFKLKIRRDQLPITFATMLIATLSISGIPPFSGFFSKDAIIAHAFGSGEYLIWGVSVVTAIFTAYYMFRLFFTVFVSGSRDKNIHPLSKSMELPLIVLAIGTIFAGFLNTPHFLGGENLFSHWIGIGEELPHISAQTEIFLTLGNLLLISFAIFVAYRRFGKNRVEPKEDSTFQRAIINKFYIDEVYNHLIVRNIRRVSFLISFSIDRKFLASYIRIGVRRYYKIASTVGVAQSGNIRAYAFYMVVGITVMTLYLLKYL
jgi:NADH-quinone oxidoreductase subunit L